MLQWRVDYCHFIGAPLKSINGEPGAWRQTPTEGVVNVHVWRGDKKHIMRGMDNYWIHEESSTYGMFNDPDSQGYEGVMSAAWSWAEPEQHIRLGNTTPPAGSHVIRGIMLPDSYARELGLL